MSNSYWLATTVTRSASVVPVFGSAMGDVCPQTALAVTGMTGRKRHVDAIEATTAPGSPPWSPPV